MDDRSRVVVAGGGVAALEAALALRALAGELVSVELVAPETRFWYRPLAVAEPFRLGEVSGFELSALAAAAGATLTPGALTSVDARRRIASTSLGGAVPYDALLIACGATPRVGIPGAVLFRGPADTPRIDAVLSDLSSRRISSLAFAIPSGAVWGLAAYELALLTASWCEHRNLAGCRIWLVSPENRPLALFGDAASDAVGALLGERGIDMRLGAAPLEVVGEEVVLEDGDRVRAEQVIALPRLLGQPIGGIPAGLDDFVPVDGHGLVDGLDDVYAAGDITSFPIKQGGLAAQQAEAAAQAIAADAGADVVPEPFRPVLRGVLLTGSRPRHLRRELTAFPDGPTAISTDPLWWPPAKISSRHLAPFLGALAGVEMTRDLQSDVDQAGVPVHVELEPSRSAEPAAGIPQRRSGSAPMPAPSPRPTVGRVIERRSE